MRGIRGLMVVVLGAALLTGCGESGPAGGLAGDLEDLPGVRAASVDRRALDTDYYAWDAVADMEGGATAAQIAEVLDRLAAWRGSDAGEERTTAVYLDAGTTDYEDGWRPDGPSMVRSHRSHTVNLEHARLLLAADAALDGPVTIFGDDFISQWRVQSSNVLETARAIRSDPVLAAAPRVVIEGANSRLGSVGPLSADWVAAYERAVGTLPQPAGARASLMYFGTPLDGEDFRPGIAPDRLQILLTIQMRERRAPQLIDADATQDPRWPAVRSQVDVMKGRPDGSQLWVWLQYDAIGNDYRRFHDLVDVTLGKPVKQGKEPSWNDEVAALLAS
jgi:hypothetical protein